MRKFDLNAAKTDDTADAAYDKIGAEIEELLAEIRLLQNEHDARATNDGDMRQLRDLLRERKENLEASLRGELSLSNGSTKGLASKGDTNGADNELTTQWGVKLLKEHGGLVEETNDTVELMIRQRKLGQPFMLFMLNLVEGLENGSNQMVAVGPNRFVPDSVARLGSEIQQYQKAFNDVMGAVMGTQGPVSGNLAQQVHVVVAEARKLHALPATSDDQILTELVKLTGTPKDTADEKLAAYVKRVTTTTTGGDAEIAVYDRIAKLIAFDRDSMPKADKADDSKYRAAVMKALAEWSAGYTTTWNELVKATDQNKMDKSSNPDGAAMADWLGRTLYTLVEQVDKARRTIKIAGVPEENSLKRPIDVAVDNLMVLVNGTIRRHNASPLHKAGGKLAELPTS